MVDHAVDGAQDHRQGLVHKDEDHGDLRQVLGVRQLLAPVGARKQRHTQGLTGDGLCTFTLLYSCFTSVLEPPPLASGSGGLQVDLVSGHSFCGVRAEGPATGPPAANWIKTAV